MVNNGMLEVRDTGGPRWALALSLLESGEAPFRLGAVRLWRDTTSPSTDGRISVTTEVAAANVSEAAALRALREAHETVEAAAAADEAFARLITKHPPRWRIICDYGMGTVLVACEDDHGRLIWAED